MTQIVYRTFRDGSDYYHVPEWGVGSKVYSPGDIVPPVNDWEEYCLELRPGLWLNNDGLGAEVSDEPAFDPTIYYETRRKRYHRLLDHIPGMTTDSRREAIRLELFKLRDSFPTDSWSYRHYQDLLAYLEEL